MLNTAASYAGYIKIEVLARTQVIPNMFLVV